ncbi:MAG: NADH-quinone oxidoreductase subunit NuoE [Candidatus Tectimicrobiota bacterium]
MLDAPFLETLRKIEARYPDRRSALLPALFLLQERDGCITPEGMQALAAHFDLSPMAVYEVASFYTMLHLQPVGRHHIQVCRTLPCALRGAGQVIALIGERLGITVGERTPDAAFSLQAVECLGSCHTAPMMQVNDLYYENLTRAMIDAILTELKDKDASCTKRPGPDGF